ncbi:hypothetical protein HBH98_145120 [Parastagonospora nodorum]|nr:hypothetical protein HBI10_171930 [Parastagonospora nodorum]KAH4016209.1 hypothetical protein HBI13_154830 [Parastagonospora nodorum]KAH4343642.1 hypothetical protein HBH98_145120 [Parastagonospora nodorum]KAH4371154.1 hypothetical protein HBH97_137500 [Parastagonospora nodorum]KAH4394093.1 hypothetical protein HBH99_141580 [Parastagonospora nodorum]
MVPEAAGQQSSTSASAQPEVIPRDDKTAIFRPTQREIRVLDLLPGNTGDQIECKVRIISLDGKEQYEALSYVWGERSTPKEIVASGQNVSVTENLYAALERLRNPQQIRTIWIDQLCINQSDNLERSNQVAMMRDIYRRCSVCVIWLGELGDIDSQAATAVFGFLKEVAAIATTEYLGLPILFRQTPEGEAARRAFAALAMYGNPWWSRIWTVQEAIIPHDAVFVWGHLTVSRADILATSRHLRSDLMHAHFPETFKAKRVHHYEMLRRMLYPVHGFIHSSSHDGPLDLLMRWRHRDATDPRDKVYALMGLLPRDVVPSARSYDYETPASLLFANVTFDLIQLEQGLRPFIGSSEMSHKTMGLPTWAIDFATTNRLGRRQLKWWNHSHRYRQFSASGAELVQASLLDRGIILSLKGSFVDEIEVCSEVYEVPDNVPFASRKLYNTVMDWTKLLDDWRNSHGNPTEYTSGGSWKSALYMTVLGDLIMAEYPIERAKPLHEKYLENLWTSLLLDKTHNSLYESLCGIVPNQAFFITKKGYIGVGSPDARPGNEVWVLYGGQVPFVLRKIDHKNDVETVHERELVGDAYTHGIMDGEAIQAHHETETIWLS